MHRHRDARESIGTIGQVQYPRLPPEPERGPRPQMEARLRLLDEVCLNRVTDDIDVEITRTIEGQSESGFDEAGLKTRLYGPNLNSTTT
jgi:hypothetical protein